MDTPGIHDHEFQQRNTAEMQSTTALVHIRSATCSLLARVKNEKPKTERDLEEENGGAGVHSIDRRKHYNMKKQEWAYEIISRIADGKKVADDQRC